MFNRKAVFSLVAFAIFFLFYFFIASPKVSAQACCSDAECPAAPPCNQSGNFCNGNYVQNYLFCYSATCYAPNCPGGYTGVCQESMSTVTKSHSDYCPCGCSGGACVTCPKTCTVINRTYNQCCSPGYSQWVQEMAWSDGSGVCGYNSGACNQSDPACGTAAYCGDKICNNGETCSTCPGDCGACPVGPYCGDKICNNGETCSTCPQDCGSCGTPPYCGDLICNNGETCSTCPGDCGACTGVSCNTDVILSAAPNPANFNSGITFSISGDASTFIGDTWTGGVTGCGGPWNSISCTTNQAGSFQWSHTWKHCVGSFTNCSPTCSLTIPFTVNVPAPATPPGGLNSSCPAPGTTGNISWGAVAGATYYNVSYDISGTKNNISGTSTTLTGLTAGTAHSWSVQACNVSGCSGWSSTNSFTCVPAAPTGLSASCPAPGTTGSLSWTATSGATSYLVRVDNRKNAWSGNCAALNPGDYCGSPITNSYSFSSEPGAAYGWWVHACNAAGCSDPTSSSLDFTCVSPCPGGLGACGGIPQAGLPDSRTIGVCNGTWAYNPGPSLAYNLWCAANANPVRGYCYQCNTNITPWIQTTGDVHSNERINAPGGP